MMASQAMNRAVVTVQPDAAIEAAAELARATGADHLLVVDEQTLVGILCACDLGDAEPGDHVSDRMSVPVVTVKPDAPIEEVAETMSACAIGCVPVAVGGLILGTVSGEELLRCGVAAPHPHRPCHHRHGRRAAPS